MRQNVNTSTQIPKFHFFLPDFKALLDRYIQEHFYMISPLNWEDRLWEVIYDRSFDVFFSWNPTLF